MPEQYDPFSLGGLFAANPHLYDYIHSLTFDSTGEVKMVDGAGQRLNTQVHGQFAIEQVGPTMFQVHLTDLVEINPYYKLERLRRLEGDARAKILLEDVPYEEQDIIRHLAPYSVQVTQEEGFFLLRRQVVWKIKDAQDWPYLLSKVRYRFEFDPLMAYELSRNRMGNLYYQLEAPESDTNLYYRSEDGQQLTARELIQMGIAVEEDQL